MQNVEEERTAPIKLLLEILVEYLGTDRRIILKWL
jgi:hypothetical protein